MILPNNVNNVTAESSPLPQPGETDLPTLKTIENHEEKKKEFLRAETVKEFTQPAVSRVEPILTRQDEDYCIQHTRRDIVKLAGKDFIILSIILIVWLAIAYQYFCKAPMAELNTTLKNTEKKLQSATKCEKNHYASIKLFFTM